MLGLLNFSSTFVPNYKKLVAPLEALLKRKANQKWTSKCTEALNVLVDTVFKRLRLRLFDASLPLKMYVGFDGGQCAVALSRVKDKVEHLVSLGGRNLMDSEMHLKDFEKLIQLASWGIRKFQCYTLNAPLTTIYTPWLEVVALVKDKGVHVQFRAKLLDLEMYNVKWAPGKDVWQVNGEILSMVNEGTDPDFGEGLVPP